MSEDQPARLAELIGDSRFALYEPPFVVDDARATTEPEYHKTLTELLAREQRGPAVRLFLELVGLPAALVAVIRITPLWPKLKAIAHTLPYDSLTTVEHQQGRPLSYDRWASLDQHTLVLCGGASDAWMRNGTQALANTLPNATYRRLNDQTHNLQPKIVAPELARFFNSAPFASDRGQHGSGRQSPNGLTAVGRVRLRAISSRDIGGHC